MSPVEGFRSPVGKPKVQGKRTITTTTNGDGTAKRVIQDVEDLDVAREREAPTFERDQFTRAGMGGFTGGAGLFDMPADPSWVSGGLLTSPEVAGYGESIGAMPPYESPAPGVQFDEYAGGRGAGRDEMGMQQYWQDVARRKQRQQNIGAADMAQQYEGGDESDNIMNAIMMAESRGDPLAHNPGTPENPEDSLGLYQVNWDVWGKGGEYDYLNSILSPMLNGRPLARDDLFDPQINRAAADAIRDKQGLSAWSTFNDGTYLQHLTQEEDPNLLQRAGSGIVEGIKSAWGEPTTRSGVGFDRQHTAEDPDFTREDAPEGIPQEIYNQLRDNHYFGQELGVTSEAGAAEGAMPGSSYIGQDDREAALAFQTERDRRKRIQDQMAQGQMPPPRYEDTGLLAGPSEEELAESTARLTSPALAATQQTGIDYYAAEPELDQQTIVADKEFDARGQLEGLLAGEPQVLFIDEDTGQPVTMQDIVMMQVGGVGGVSARMLKGFSLQRLKKLWQQFKGRGKPPVTKPKVKYSDLQADLKRKSAEQWKRFNELSKKPPVKKLYPKEGSLAKEIAVGTSIGAGVGIGIDRFDDIPELVEKDIGGATTIGSDLFDIGKSSAQGWYNFLEQRRLDKKQKEIDDFGPQVDTFEEFTPPGLLETPAEVVDEEPEVLATVAKRARDDDSGIPPSAQSGGVFWTESDARTVTSEGLNTAVNRVWANFPKNIDAKRERYLSALNEIYKKVAILNVIAALTNSPSMAPQFLELASARFETLEGFRGEERLQKIANGVFFTEDGRFDPPKSKRNTYDRALAFGATPKEAETISDYMPEKETVDVQQYYRDKGDGTWEVIRRAIDPGEPYIEGKPSGSPPSAGKGEYSPSAIEKKHDLLDEYIAVRKQAMASGVQADIDAINYKIKTLRSELDKEGARESVSDSMVRIRKVYTDEYTLRGGGLATIGTGTYDRPPFEEWLLNEGLIYTKMHLGDSWKEDVEKFLRRNFASEEEAQQAADNGIIKPGDPIMIAGVPGLWE